MFIVCILLAVLRRPPRSTLFPTRRSSDLVPSFYDDVERPAQCRVKFLDYDGNPQEIECDGLLATCIQHEIDHLNGIVFLDHLSRLKRQMVLKKMRKAEREKQADAAAGSF